MLLLGRIVQLKIVSAAVPRRRRRARRRLGLVGVAMLAAAATSLPALRAAALRGGTASWCWFKGQSVSHNPPSIGHASLTIFGTVLAAAMVARLDPLPFI